MSGKKDVKPTRELPARSSRGQKDVLNNYDLLEQTRLWEEHQRLAMHRIKRARKQRGELVSDDEIEQLDDAEEEEKEEEVPEPTVKRSANKRVKKATARKAARKPSDTVEEDADSAAAAEDSVEAEEANGKVDTSVADVEHSAKKAKHESKKNNKHNADEGEENDSHDNDDRKEASPTVDIQHFKQVVSDIIHKLTDYNSITSFMTHAAETAKQRINLLSNDGPAASESDNVTDESTEQVNEQSPS